MNDVDFTGVRVLREVLSELDAQKIAFAMARVGEHVRASLSKGGLDDKITDANIYPSADAAVSAFLVRRAS
jgi:MFS superfamily sulfate permease-like transporter